jgi:hypothetical protein
MALLTVFAVVLKLYRDYSTGREAFRVRHSGWRFAAGTTVQNPWWIYPAFGLGGLLLFFWFLSRAQNAYYAAALLDGSETAVATVTAGALPREEAQYAFEVNGKKYTGRCTEQLGKGDTLPIVYDPNAPETNRPKQGLYFDIIMGTGLFLFLLGAAIWIIPFRRMSTYPEPRNAKSKDLLHATDFPGAVEALRLDGGAETEEELPRLAEEILAAWRKKPERYEPAAEALKRMEKLATSPRVAKEVRSFQEELEHVHKSWERLKAPEHGRQMRP